jgi:UDPglucose 6-dehydrogenase
MNKKIGIIGLGYVGKAFYRFFGSHYQTTAYDSDHDVLYYDKAQVSDVDVAVICVPTPSRPDRRCDTSIVEEVIDWCKAELIIIKSTIEPGTTENLIEKYKKRIVFSPEYCGESSYWSPYPWDREIKECPFFIFGGRPKDTAEAVNLYLPICGPVKKYVQTGATEAEMAKYMENSFFATKIAFVYEIAQICKRTGVDYNTVREIWLNDPRINPMHTAVFENNIKPFGGKCLPKDLNALIAYAEEVLGYQAGLLKEVMASNERIGRLRKDDKCHTH